MVGMFAPTSRAHRILIALLAFALAVALAIVASAAPADAAKDVKEYTVSAPAGTVITSVEITFFNVSPDQQLAGSFLVQFPGFTSVTVTDIDRSDWNPVPDAPEAADDTAIISADSGGSRIAPNESVTVTVSWTDAPAGETQLFTKGDQQAGGVFKGGNDFTNAGADPTITVCGFALCGAGFRADVACASCTLSLGPENGQLGVNADVVVGGDDQAFILVVTTTTGKAGPPGKATATIFDSPKFPDGTELPSCGLKGAEPVVNCFHVNRVSGNNLEYTVILDADPRIKF